MRIILLLLLMIIITISHANAEGWYVVPIQKDVGVYQNRTRTRSEPALFTLTQKSRCVVLEQRGASFKLKDSSGRIGWVKRRLVKTVDKSALIEFGEATIVGYIDDPTTIYILDGKDYEGIALRLERSFLDELSISIDRESIERIR